MEVRFEVSLTHSTLVVTAFLPHIYYIILLIHVFDRSESEVRQLSFQKSLNYISFENVININYPLSLYVISLLLILYIKETCEKDKQMRRAT